MKPENENWMMLGNFAVKPLCRVVDYRTELGLSLREAQLLELFAMGLNKSGIEARMGVSQNTIDTYKRRLFQKLGVNSMIAAVSLVVHVVNGGPTLRLDEMDREDARVLDPATDLAKLCYHSERKAA